MIIGIDASRAFLKERTGVEEYSYQTIKSLRDKLGETQVFLYVRREYEIDFNLPENWKIKEIKFPYLWTQVGLSLEMRRRPVDALFVPSHVTPFIHPRKTFVTVHGLEYEKMPEAYSFLGRLYMRWSIKFSCRWATRIIAVSENTKKDLVALYKIPAEKIEVVYEGVSEKFQIPNSKLQINSKFKIQNSKFFLFIGRLENRKNIVGMIRAFRILKERYNLPHKLVLAGKFGYGEKEIHEELRAGKYIEDIVFLGFISDEEKRTIIEKAEVFLFPTFYEGFGLPILEAQALGVPVVASNTSSLPEVGGESVSYCDPSEPISIAEAIMSIIGDEARKKDLIEKGLENVKRFSWDVCASEIANILLESE